jgi:hypothetical protein
VDAARRVSGFHTAAVVDADASSDQPWLVTAYIPAPSLHEVINRQRPAGGAGLVRARGGAGRHPHGGRRTIDEHRAEATALTRVAAQRTEPPEAARDQPRRTAGHPAVSPHPPAAQGSDPSSTMASSRSSSPPSAASTTRRPSPKSSAEPLHERTHDGVNQRSNPPELIWGVGLGVTIIDALGLTMYIDQLATGEASLGEMVPLLVFVAGMITVGLVMFFRGLRKARADRNPGSR